LREQRSACRRIADQLATESDYDRVSVRPLTGSVIIERETPELVAADIGARLGALVSHETTEDGRALIGSEPERPRGTKLAAAIVRATHRINADLRAALDDEADLGTLAPLGLVALGALHVSLSGQLPAPPWSSLVWYAVRTFNSFNGAAIKEAVERAEASGVDAPNADDLLGGQETDERTPP
jgi:hypothetical protein